MNQLAKKPVLGEKHLDDDHSPLHYINLHHDPVGQLSARDPSGKSQSR
jgi:hypothetical protein